MWALNRVKLKTKATQAQEQCKKNNTNAKDTHLIHIWSICLWYNQTVQKGNWPIWFGFLWCELDPGVNIIDMVEKFLLVCRTNWESCLQKTNPYWHVFALGQLPPPGCKIQCHQHPQTQGKNCMYNQTVIGKRRRPSIYSPKKMQISCMGLEQNKYPEETEEKQPRDQQHQQVLHCGAIHERPRRNLQKHLQKIWGGGLLQGRKHHQRSPSTPQV